MGYGPVRPAPLVAAWDWQLRGACRGLDVDVFFHPENERGEQRKQRDADALQVCAGCPVAGACREYALRAREPYGVWGGLTEEARRDMVSGEEEHRRAV